MSDLPVHEAFADELKHLDLTVGRLLLELLERSGKRDDLAALVLRPPRRDFVEAAGVVDVAVEDFFSLCGVHDGLGIDHPHRRL